MTVAAEPRQLRDQMRRELIEQPKDTLARDYDGVMRRVETRAGKDLEVLIRGTYDYDDDPTSFFYVWIYVRPRWVARIPVLRWLLSARATVVVE